MKNYKNKTLHPEPSFREKIAEMWLIPKDTILGYSIISMVGNDELVIENHRGILEYNDQLIRIHTKKGQIKINGKTLHISHYTSEEMKVKGYISGIEFQE